MQEHLSVAGVSVEFDGLRALTDVSLELRRGEILGLIGPNGAGKTTLINVISGFQRPAAGRVDAGAEDITAWSPDRRARTLMARTFQAGRLFKHMTIRENLEVAALASRLSPRAARLRAAEIAEMCGLVAELEREASGLPHGVERVVGVARAAATRAPILLLDEPAAGLNAGESDRLAGVVERLRTEGGRSILLIEHDVPLVMKVCDRLHVLNYGRTLAEGSPREIRDNVEVQRAYLGGAEEDPDA